MAKKRLKGCGLPRGKTPAVQSRTTNPMARTKPDAIQPKQTYKSKPKMKAGPESEKVKPKATR